MWAKGQAVMPHGKELALQKPFPFRHVSPLTGEQTEPPKGPRSHDQQTQSQTLSRSLCSSHCILMPLTYP